MIAELLAKSNVVEILSADLDAATGSTKIVVRVQEEKSWIRMFSEAVKIAYDDDLFGLEVHKIFYATVTDGVVGVRYAWTILHWGEGEHLQERLAPVLTRCVAKPPPFALGRNGAKVASAQREAPSKPARTVPPSDGDEDEPEGPEIRSKAKREGGRRTIEFVRAVEDGGKHIHDVYRVPLAHVHHEQYTRNQNPDEIIGLGHGKKNTAVVQGVSERAWRPKGAKDL